jgi:hypothetical protein
MHIKIVDPRGLRDFTDEVKDDITKAPQVMPASFYRAMSVDERALLGARNGWYAFPTVELIDWLRAAIGGRSAIEIGAGHGAIAAALGIPATDNKMQEDSVIAALYQHMGQLPVSYGPQVERLDALQAVAHYRPQVVVAAWVTHLWRDDFPELGGNMFGVYEEAVIDACETYIFIGNRKVHEKKPIWSRPHTLIEPDWLASRATNGSPDFIAIWGKQ